MKILHIETGRQLAGGPQQVVTLMKGLDELGVDSTLLCPDDSAVASLAEDAQLKVKRVPYKGEHDFSLARAIRDTALEGEFDFIHAHSRRGGDNYAAFAARRTKIPAILTRRVLNRENCVLAGIKYRSFVRIVGVSEAVDRSLKRQRVDAAKRTVIYDGIDPRAYAQPYPKEKLRAEFGLPEDAVVLGCVGRFTKNKAQLSLLKAFALIHQSLPQSQPRPQLHLVLFGDGAMFETLVEFVRLHRLTGQVHFAGFRSDMPRWYGALDMLAHTASMEALSVALLESGACGLPLIAYDNGGVCEVIRHGINGLLVPPAAIDQLAHAIRRLARNPQLRRSMGRAARQHCEKFFSAERMVSQYRQLYDQLHAEFHAQAGQPRLKMR